MRIGVISDTHIPLNAKELPPRVAEVFAGVEIILHAGDIYLPAVLDELEAVAPVFAAYGDGDARLHIKLGVDRRVKKSHIINVEGLRVGLIHSIRLPRASVEGAFGSPVDIAVCGHTHEAKVETHQGVIVVNPGSATLPDHQLNKSGTVGIMDITQGKVAVRIVQLDRLP